jgi:hypothetical protein
MDQIMTTSAFAAGLSLQFHGETLVLGLDFGKTSADFKWRLDYGEWMDFAIDRIVGAPEDDGRFLLLTVVSDLPIGVHHVEIEIVHGNRDLCRGTNFKLVFVGYI